MNQEIEILYREYHELLDTQDFNESELDYSIAERHIELLKVMDVIENSSLEIFDLFKKDHIFFSTRFESLFGFDIEQAITNRHDYLDSRIHPDDSRDMLRAGNYFLRIAFSMPPDKRKEYKLIADFRIRNGRDELVRVVKQYIPIEQDCRGNVWLSLNIMDLSPDQDLEMPFRCRVVNTKTGELFHFPQKENTNSEKPQLSVREIEILKHISEGFGSKQIADKLFLSIFTVNTHRQRIIEKLSVKNTFEAIKYATDVGWLM